MTREQRVLMVASGEATRWEHAITSLESTFSRRVRAQWQEYTALRGVLGAALADPDDTITFRVGKRRPNPRSAGAALLLALLGVALVIEWGTYTVPGLRQYLDYLAHKCGLR